MANRGYAGYYKNIYLRSSYEYAYAKLLDEEKVEWGYEQKTYDLGYRKYTPDFFIYGNGQLKYIVEIKSEVKKEQDKALKALNELKKQYGINGFMLTYKDLYNIYLQKGLNLNKTINEWIKSEKTTINKNISGENNPHYGLSHSEETKKIIGEQTKQRWKINRKIYLEASKKGAQKAKEVLSGRIKVKRINKICPICNKEFKVLITDKQQKYCSQLCANKTNSKLGTEKQKQEAKILRDKIKEFIMGWAKDNKEIILSTPYNKIKTNLKPLFDDIENKYGIKDLRIISKSVFGEDKGRKELLRFLKEYVS